VIFREYDKDKAGIFKEDVKKVVRRLCNDECYIGKVPDIEDFQVIYCDVNIFIID
jgi:hypothetical protein